MPHDPLDGPTGASGNNIPSGRQAIFSHFRNPSRFPIVDACRRRIRPILRILTELELTLTWNFERYWFQRELVDRFKKHPRDGFFPDV